ncbi:TetR family transcriptional regulator [Clostridium fermenticellae]|uniref:TetR family transcriptional regulator n=2 Tax=Clostridium fermenticellae TaxID=2068654 RepID=A0A386H4J7_9CLOT|nr:TetR family transcriptional regulator [Clostridium fermenticellae]
MEVIMSKTEDIRIQKSKNAIQKAFIKLMKKEGFSKITVKELIADAKVNRSTFYAHYLDKYDLLEQLEQKLLNSISENMHKAPVEQILNHKIDNTTLSNYLSNMLKYMYKNGEIFMMLYGNDGDTTFHNKLNQLVLEIYKEKQLSDNFSIPVDYAMSAIIGTITSLIDTWIRKGFVESPENFTEIVMKVSSALQSHLIK